MRPLSLYIHIPFCQRKCHYCDFNTYAGLAHLIPPYLEALKEEMRRWAPLLAGWEVSTVFLGGGTPSLLTGTQVQELLALCRQDFQLAEDVEISLEANPGTVDPTRLEGYRAAGVNRLSFGAQSFHPEELHWLGRIHSDGEIGEAVRLARAAEFTRINLDLIYGLPQQPLERWESSLHQALDLGPDHLSLYALTVEEGTPLAQWVASGRVPEPDPDLAADHYLAAERMLAQAGFHQYEISNWARPGQECQHNLTYWRNLPYVGLGAGAHSSFGGYRFFNVLQPQHYLRRVQEDGRREVATLKDAIQHASPVAEIHAVDGETDLSDTLILGLRLAEGVSFRKVADRHSVDVPARYGPAIQDLCQAGLLEADSQGMRLTPRGRLLANEAFLRFLPSSFVSTSTS